MSLFIAIGIIAVIAVVVFLLLSGPTSVDMKDYVKVSYTGCDGYGKASISIDRDKFIILRLTLVTLVMRYSLF